MEKLEANLEAPVQPSRWAGTPGVCVALALYWLVSMSALVNTCSTYDETIHLHSGLLYWRGGDYRQHLENGNLPQRWGSIPELLAGAKPVLPDSKVATNADKFEIAHRFFYGQGNPIQLYLLVSRAQMALIGVAIGWLVFSASRCLFGLFGGWASMLLCLFHPMFLGYVPLVTSDGMAALFFLLAVGAFWTCLHRTTWATFAISSFALAGLFLSKFSCVIAVPMLSTLWLVWVLANGDDKFKRAWQGLLILVGHGLVVWACIWLAYGCRYSMAPTLPNGESAPSLPFEPVLDKLPGGKPTIQFARDYRLLPEAYLYGFGFVLVHADSRHAYLNGEHSSTGWWWYFPYGFLIKTPIPFFLVLLLAVVAALRTRIGDWAARLYETAPWWTLLGFYWAFSLTSHLNIGVRHILPTLPPLCILAGAAVHALRRRDSTAVNAGRSIDELVAGFLITWYVLAVLSAWPFYIAYCNTLGGGSSQGYQRMVDSSMDWGQELPRLQSWFQQHQDRQPAYLFYFGVGNPGFHKIPATILPNYNTAQHPLAVTKLEPGWYCVSATLLAGLYLSYSGPWNSEFEDEYQKSRTMETASEDRKAAWTQKIGEPAARAQYARFDMLRYARLFSYLRQRVPNDHVGHAILIFHLSEKDLEEALVGPPAEMRPRFKP